MRRLVMGVWLACVGGVAPVWAQDSSGSPFARPLATLEEASLAVAIQDAVPAENGPSTYDQIWRFARWYDNEDNPVVQSVLFSGRFQVDYASVDADGGQGHHSEWNVRRFRFGAKAQLFERFTLHSEAEFNPQEADPFYMRLTDTYLQWSRNPGLQITVGKHSAPFTADGATSSKELLTIDRSNLTNNIWFTQEYFPGVSVTGERSDWVYRAGLYSAGGRNREFGDFKGSVFFLGVVGYDLADRLDVREGLLTVDYVYQDEDPENTFTQSLGRVLSVSFRLDTGRWGLHTDVSTAAGYSRQSDLWGVMAMPFYSVTDRLQLVARYTFLESETLNGVRLARYESQLVSGRGDEYHELYAGLNYYFYGHKLKFQSGLQFADMNDQADDGGAYEGVAWTSGLRVSW